MHFYNCIRKYFAICENAFVARRLYSPATLKGNPPKLFPRTKILHVPLIISTQLQKPV